MISTVSIFRDPTSRQGSLFPAQHLHLVFLLLERRFPQRAFLSLNMQTPFPFNTFAWPLQIRPNLTFFCCAVMNLSRRRKLFHDPAFRSWRNSKALSSEKRVSNSSCSFVSNLADLFLKYSAASIDRFMPRNVESQKMTSQRGLSVTL